MKERFCGHHYPPNKVTKYLVEFYANLSTQELCYEYLQPYCSYCQSTLSIQNCLPLFCTSCGTQRWDDSPLMKELEKRHLSESVIFKYLPHYERYSFCEGEYCDADE